MRNQIDFERFAIDRGLDTAKKVNGDYREYDTYLAFETWQASRSVALESAQIVESDHADFEKGTWTFNIPDGCKVGSGKYAILAMQGE
ncbi:MAG: hypothetical protein ABFE02_01875 [Sulfuricella sp.]